MMSSTTDYTENTIGEVVRTNTALDFRIPPFSLCKISQAGGRLSGIWFASVLNSLRLAHFTLPLLE